ncbi:MAG: allophanate hydrolase subunit 1 [Novosphingobium sp.]|uniref:5-oxoprolinase subunit B family protein n=1 Tax=Novosphingobium sp. TaxID=1874826 RepID=UPI0030191A08
MTDMPVVRAVGDSALLIDFGERIDKAINARVVALDRALAASPPPGLIETVPAYCSLLIEYDPLVTTQAELASAAMALAQTARAGTVAGREHVVPISFVDAPDLARVAEQTGLSPAAAISAFLAGCYRVFMYGFAPGYAYMGGVPPALHLPRKPVAERGHPVGSVIIAGPQCLITTLPMPTGWWVIGRTPLMVLDPLGERPFRFDPGDTIRFERMPPE